MRSPRRLAGERDDENNAGGFRPLVSRLGGSAVRPGVARLDGLVFAAGGADARAGILSGGGRNAPGTGRADGGAVGTTGGAQRDDGPGFDRVVPPGGYAWWYVDALSDDGQFGLTIIAFIGSVFSPYYAWAGRKDPLDHCAVNVALYGPRGHRWAMTERRRASLRRDRDNLSIGLSALSWNGRALTIHIDEMTVPIPSRLRGVVVVEPTGINEETFELAARGQHIWRPIAPSARVSVNMSAPELTWTGDGYLDMNAGAEALEAGFSDWSWSRAGLRDGAMILYDARPRDSDPVSLALRFNRSGESQRVVPPPVAQLPRTLWRLPRETRSEDGAAVARRTFEDTPFYSRSLVSGMLCGERVMSVHESLALDRFAHPLVRLMLPFRMPRR
jgi:carotenoid 1,2-hydratase